MVRQRCIAEEYLSHILDEHCLEDIRISWCISYPGACGEGALATLRHMVTTKLRVWGIFFLHFFFVRLAAATSQYFGNLRR